ncbi:MAG: NAD-dependent deacylase [Chloroflexi bacterium]|nr:NAD-dependent deacylase [Chloroflexota bacterium]
MVSQSKIDQAARLLHPAKHPSALTGAGVSKESGIPTFRDALDGLWARFNPQELATPFAFLQNPKLVWDFYEYRRQLMRPAKPNPGHRALAELERIFGGLPIITQNIDALHEDAGSAQVIALHGKIAVNKCFYNCQGDPTPVDVSKIAYDQNDGPPPCPHCGRKMVRPAVVWFGEMLPPAALAAARAVLHTTDVMLVIGTSGIVQPAASMPLLAQDSGAALIEVNPYESELTDRVDLWLDGPSGEVLPRLVAAVKKLRGNAG